MFLLTIFLIILFQLLCVGANFPSLPKYNSLLGAPEAAVAFLFVAFTLPRAIVSPLWGIFSDKVGRKPLMILGVLAGMVASVLWLVSDHWMVLFSSRLIDGFFSAQALIIAAMITDTIPTEKRAKAFGLLGAGVSLGLTIGPIWGAWITQNHGPQSVAYGFLVLQLLSLLLVIFFLPETFTRKERKIAKAEKDAAKAAEREAEKTKLAETTSATPADSVPQPERPLNARSIFKKWMRAYKFPPRQILRRLLFISLGSSVVISAYTTAMPLATEAMFNWHAWQHGQLFATLGFVSALTQGGILRQLLKHIEETRLMIFGIALLAIGYAVMTFAGIEGLWVGTIILALGGGIAAPCITNQISHRTKKQNIGHVLGLNQTLQTLGRAIGFLLAAVGFLVLPVGGYLLALGVGVVVIMYINK